MSVLEDQVRAALLAGADGPTSPDLTERILARVERDARRRRAASVVVAVAVVASLAAAGAWLRGGSDHVTPLPADRGQPTAAPTLESPPTLLAFQAAQQRWVICLRRHGVTVYGPDGNLDVSFNPDPDLAPQVDACAHLRPGLSDQVERELQPSTPAPGASVLHHLAPPVVVTRTGPSTVPLGAAPVGADALDLRLQCLTAGTFTFPDGANIKCSAGDPARATEGGYPMTADPSLQSLTIDAGQGQRWQLSATWSRTEAAPYGLNAHGQTYGSAGNATSPGQQPDLIAVEAGGGRTGYVYREELDAGSGKDTLQEVQERLRTGQTLQPTSIPMYESDGRTRIGTFRLG